MDLATILVLFLILGTIGLLVWAELKSRRNQRARAESDSAKDEANRPEEPRKQP